LQPPEQQWGVSAEAQFDLRPHEAPILAENVESCLSTSSELHLSHFTLLAEFGTSFSNALPHERHSYSNMGMGRPPFIRGKYTMKNG
jgi:hypothetical protein